MNMSITLRTILDFKNKEFLFERYQHKKLNCNYWNVKKEKIPTELIINKSTKDKNDQLDKSEISKTNIPIVKSEIENEINKTDKTNVITDTKETVQNNDLDNTLANEYDIQDNNKNIDLDHENSHYNFAIGNILDMSVLSRKFLDDTEFCLRIRQKDLSTMTTLIQGKNSISKQAENISFRRHTFNYIIAELHSKIVKEICIKSENDEIFKITYKALVKILDIVKGNTDMDKRIFFMNHDMKFTLKTVIKHVIDFLEKLKTDEAIFGVKCYKKISEIISQIEYYKMPFDILKVLYHDLVNLGIEKNEVLFGELNKLCNLKNLKIAKAWENKKIQSIKAILLNFEEYVKSQKNRNNLKNLDLDLKENENNSYEEKSLNNEDNNNLNNKNDYDYNVKDKYFTISKVFEEKELKNEDENDFNPDSYNMISYKSLNSFENISSLIKQYNENLKFQFYTKN